MAARQSGRRYPAQLLVPQFMFDVRCRMECCESRLCFYDNRSRGGTNVSVKIACDDEENRLFGKALR